MIGVDRASGPDQTKVGLWDSQTDKLLGVFDTVEQAIEYADEHDLQCYIKGTDAWPDLYN